VFNHRVCAAMNLGWLEVILGVKLGQKSPSFFYLKVSWNVWSYNRRIGSWVGKGWKRDIKVPGRQGIGVRPCKRGMCM
jgi:hypothetical protein